MTSIASGAAHGAPTVTALRVIPVAGHDGMLMNLSGAHAPFFTRNIVILTDSSGNTGVGEVPGGEKIRQTLEDARPLVEGQPIGHYNAVLQAMRQQFHAYVPFYRVMDEAPKAGIGNNSQSLVAHRSLRRPAAAWLVPKIMLEGFNALS